MDYVGEIYFYSEEPFPVYYSSLMHMRSWKTVAVVTEERNWENEYFIAGVASMV